MNKIETQLQKIKREKRIGIMAHVVVGYPSLTKSIELIQVLIDSGVDFIELQIPFSDPLADGPMIMHACEASLSKGTKVADAFKIMQLFSVKTSIPLLFMGYFNTVFKYGVEAFCCDAKKSGASGLIFPDFSIDEEDSEHFLYYSKKYELHNIHVLSPASTEYRLKKNAQLATGFVYCTAHQGITGTKDSLNSDINTYLDRVKHFFTIPMAVGFGISKKEHLQALSNHVDIAVIGSVLIKELEKNGIDGVKKLLKDLFNNN